MMPGKRLKVPIIALFAIFAGLSTYCYGQDCGFDSTCPYVTPPCYKVTFGDIIPCHPEPGYCILNGPYFLSYNGWSSEYGYCRYFREEDPTCSEIYITLYVIADGDSTVGFTDTSLYYWGCEGASTSGFCNCNNLWPIEACYRYPEVIAGYGGWAQWEPIWDCSACDAECTLDVVSSPDTTIHYANEDCCPPASKGDEYTVTIDCNSDCSGGTVYVVPEVGPYDANLVTVKYDPNCRADNRVNFDLQAKSGSGDPNTFTEVTCTASFFCSITGMGSGSATVTVRPHCEECCEAGKEGDPTDCPPEAGSI